MPTTRVPKSRGAMIVLIILRKIWLRTRSDTATSGQSWPISAPTIIETRIHVVRERRRTACTHRPAIAIHRPAKPIVPAPVRAPAAASSRPAPRTSQPASAPPPGRAGLVTGAAAGSSSRIGAGVYRGAAFAGPAHGLLPDLALHLHLVVEPSQG